MNIVLPSVWDEIKPIFEAGFPNETVVAVYPDRWVHLENISPMPRRSFELSRDDTLMLIEDNPLVLLHSHINMQIAASDKDSANQIACGYPWGIVGVWGDEINGNVYEVKEPECWGMDTWPELVGRTYMWGIRDCASLVRDYHRSIGFNYRAKPRIHDAGLYPDTHWAADQIRHHIIEDGFVKIARDDRKPGDMITQCWGGRGSWAHDHCAIYMGEGKYLHQLHGRTSEIWMPSNEEYMLARYSTEVWRVPSKYKIA